MEPSLEEILIASERLEGSGDTRQVAATAEGLGLYRCRRPQEIRDVSMPEPSVLLVLRGRKELATTSRTWGAGVGEMLLVPADTTFWLGNYPDASGQAYRGVAIRFSTEVVELFRNFYGQEMAGRDLQPRWHAAAPATFLRALSQWIEWCGAHQQPDDTVARHRRVELLLLLAQAGLAENLLMAEDPSWRRRVAGLFHLDPGRTWRMVEVGARLGVSESTLRRHLQEEGQGFRSLLEEVRLVHGLTLVQESPWAIGRIADAVGYRSQSRFSERFKLRFGVTPTDLRQTRMPAGVNPEVLERRNGESGEVMTD